MTVSTKISALVGLKSVNVRRIQPGWSFTVEKAARSAVSVYLTSSRGYKRSFAKFNERFQWLRIISEITRLSQPVSKFARYLGKFLVTQNNDKPFLKTQYWPLRIARLCFWYEFTRAKLVACSRSLRNNRVNGRRWPTSLALQTGQNWVSQKSGEKGWQ